MSQSIKDFEKTFDNAATDLSTNRYYLVKLNSAGKAVLAGAASDTILGVLQNKPKAQEGALVRFLATSKVVIGGTVAIGANLTANASGQAIATVTTGDHVIGLALEAGVSGDVIEAIIVHKNY